MARTDRLFRLLKAMRVLAPPLTAAKLAEETGVSLRSLYRDIDCLRAAGARIEGERGYGYRLIEDYALPPQTFDRIEIEALTLGLAEVRAMGDPALTEAATSIMAKVAASLPADREQYLLHAVSKAYRPEARYPRSDDLDLIRQSCWREETLAIHYEDEHGAVTERTILPLGLVYSQSSLVALAWCELRQGFRMFRIDRILKASSEGTSFRPRRAPLLRLYLQELEHRDVEGETR